MSDATQSDYYRGVPFVPYDLVKELVIALAGTLVLALVLAAVLSSPDVPPETIQSWAQKQPLDFVTTAAAELQGSTTTANYGPPYNDGDGSVQSLGFFSPQTWFGVHEPVSPADDFVLNPLQAAATTDSGLRAALARWTGAGDQQRKSWLDAYTKALKDAKVSSSGEITMAEGDYGPLPGLMTSLLGLAQAGGLDGYLLTAHGRFYATDYTLPLLFMGDGGYLSSLAEDQHLLGDQWGMMNETGLYPGQTWLWLYTAWYQLPPFNGSSNADLMVVLVMTVLSLALVFTPFIPVLRDIPRWVPVHRLIWRRYYAAPPPSSPAPADAPKPAGVA